MSMRPDGSLRQEVRVRPGYVPPEERPKYIPPPKRENTCTTPTMFYYVTRPYYGPYPSQMTDEEVTRWLAEKKWLKKVKK